MPPKSIKLYWNEKNVNSGDVLKVLFGDRKDTLAAARLLITRMKANQNLAMTKRELRFFAKELQSGKSGVKYSYHNFYTKLLRKLLDLGFIDRNVLIWDAKRRKTAAVYQLRLQAISERPPQGGFVKQTWQLARGWNELVAK
ncbi:MAG: hypothetical protein LYZ69_03405 [Nitrososphaerales archaeon]|nr:hypothetical protein [Nitrososphaerales archaeon]